MPCERPLAILQRRGATGMKVCVVGCGAVGSIFAAHLARRGEVEVHAYDVAKERVQAIQRGGTELLCGGASVR
jgi:ketopantoate reductase